MFIRICPKDASETGANFGRVHKKASEMRANFSGECKEVSETGANFGRVQKKSLGDEGKLQWRVQRSLGDGCKLR